MRKFGDAAAQIALVVKVISVVSPWIVIAGLAGIGAWLTDLNFWPVLAITAVAVLANGWVATLEDDLPGGFNNPDGTATPRYAVVAKWALRAVGIALAAFCLLAIGLWLFG